MVMQNVGVGEAQIPAAARKSNRKHRVAKKASAVAAKRDRRNRHRVRSGRVDHRVKKTALPKMAKAAHSEELQEAFQKHESETEDHVERLDKVFAELDETPRGRTCDAIVGIIEEGQEVMKEYKGSPALDAGLLAAAQAVEHYEISRYGTLKTWAQELGLEEAVKLLDTTLAEEKKTDELLTELAESSVNQHAEAA
jgi:ferritin-like metal-binding protein YciE